MDARCAELPKRRRGSPTRTGSWTSCIATAYRPRPGTHWADGADADAKWWRFRAPVHDFLSHQASLTIGAELLDLRLIASRWYADRGGGAAALRLAVAAQNRPHTARVVVRFATPLLLGNDRIPPGAARSQLSTVDSMDSPVAALAVATAERDDVDGVRGFRMLGCAKLLDRWNRPATFPCGPRHGELSNLVITRRHQIPGQLRSPPIGC